LNVINPYRNLLVQIARDVVGLTKEVEDIRKALPAEKDPRRKRGMETIINCRNRNKSRLLQLLARNRTACQEFFGTKVPEEIAQEKMLQ
jgi:hypothetical protein